MKIKYKYGLSDSEFNILKYMANGNTNPEIAQKNFVCESTVKMHISHIFEKMKVHNRIQAVVKAIRENIV